MNPLLLIIITFLLGEEWRHWFWVFLLV